MLLTILDTIIGSLHSQLPSEKKKKKISFWHLEGDYVCLIQKYSWSKSTLFYFVFDKVFLFFELHRKYFKLLTVQIPMISVF